jgi:Flp pilus assembly protein TadD
LGDLASEIYDIVPLESEVEELPLMSESLEQAWRCFRQQDTEGCLRWLSKSDPSVGRFMLECHVSGSTNDHAAELVAALRASDLAPGLAEPAFRKSCALMKLGRFVEAVPVAEDLTASHPKEPTYLQHLGGVYLRGGRLNDARRVIERARVLSPNSPGLIALGAWVAWRCGDYQSALDDATRALEMAPGIQHAHRARCYALWSLGDRAAARTALALAMRAYPDDGLLRRLAAQADDRLLAGTQE